MINPKSLGPSPLRGDEDIYKTYSGVGLVLSFWESMEVQLSLFYADLVGKPRSKAAVEEYGGGRIFTERADKLKGAFERWCISAPCQTREGQFCKLLEVVRGLASDRNDIAHGVVMSVSHRFLGLIDIHAPLRFCLFPPHYDPKRNDGMGDPEYAYDFEQMNQLASRISRTTAEMLQFRYAAFPPPNAWPSAPTGP